jgi:hypothetical protein
VEPKLLSSLYVWGAECNTAVLVNSAVPFAWNKAKDFPDICTAEVMLTTTLQRTG